MVFMLLGVNVTFAQDLTVDKGGEFKFVWDANSEPDMAGYRIYMRTPSTDYVYGAGNEYAAVGLMTEPLSGPHAISAVGTYHFVVTAYDDEGLESGPSTEATLIVENQPPKPPAGCAILKF
jgi:hypothetical protein